MDGTFLFDLSGLFSIRHFSINIPITLGIFKVLGKPLGGFPIEIKSKIRYHHNFTLWNYDNNNLDISALILIGNPPFYLCLGSKAFEIPYKYVRFQIYLSIEGFGFLVEFKAGYFK